MQHCYTCRHHSMQMEKLNTRKDNGEKGVTKQIQVERCEAQGGRELMLPVVVGSQITIMTRQKFDALVIATPKESPNPFVYGSEAEYNETLCPLYLRKDRKLLWKTS
jgi:hypothetical protein